jgi:hypothetical protein
MISPFYEVVQVEQGCERRMVYIVRRAWGIGTVTVPSEVKGCVDIMARRVISMTKAGPNLHFHWLCGQGA